MKPYVALISVAPDKLVSNALLQFYILLILSLQVCNFKDAG